MKGVRKGLLAFLALLVWALPGQAQAQTGTIAGRIFDDTSLRPLEGVTLTVVGTGRTGLTNADGRFVITAVPVGEQIILAEILGYADATRTVTVTADQTAIVDIQMTNEAIQLQEIVVTGYGVQTAEDVTGVIDAVGTEQFNQGVITAPEELIAGKVAGVAVVTPGFRGGVNIRIRGGTSINASNEPLFVVDGVPIAPGGGLGAGSNPLSFINPQDIESVTVLKDASAAVIYGSRGANGVIIIQTKRGSAGSSISYTGSVNMSNRIGEIDLVGADDFRAAVAEFNPSSSALLLNANTDWRDEIMRTAYGQEHNLSVTGGSESSNYRVSLGYFGRDGIVQGSDTERITAALNFNQLLFNETFSVRANVRGSRIVDNFEGNNISNATGFAPTQPVFDEDGSYYEWDAAAGLSPENPFPEIQNIVDEGTAWRSLGSLELEWDIPGITGLTATSDLGYDVTQAENVYFRGGGEPRLPQPLQQRSAQVAVRRLPDLHPALRREPQLRGDGRILLRESAQRIPVLLRQRPQRRLPRPERDSRCQRDRGEPERRGEPADLLLRAGQLRLRRQVPLHRVAAAGRLVPVRTRGGVGDLPLRRRGVADLGGGLHGGQLLLGPQAPLLVGRDG